MKVPSVKIVPLTLDSVLRFGKYKGSTVRDVILSDAAYIGWCIEEVKTFVLDNKAFKLWSTQHDLQIQARSENAGEDFIEMSDFF